MSEKEKPDKTADKEDAKRKLALQGKYNQRITIAKHGREMFLNKDYVNAAKKYNEYLAILAQAQAVDDIYQISPAKFNQKTDMTEMLLISHIYWELSRVYEMTPKLQKSFDKCLKQFVRFTINQPYQVLNSEVLRKYIKKNKRTSRQILALEKAYSQIQVESKKCFVATFACGEEHWITNELRLFKKNHLKGPLGLRFTAFYYRLSSPAVNVLEKNRWLQTISKTLARPVLVLAASISKAQRLKKELVVK